MSDGKKKLLPEITINAKQEEIDIGEESKQIDYWLELKDNEGKVITNYSAVDNSTLAELSITVTRTDGKGFPDDNNWITYRFAPLEGLRKAADSSLEVPKEKEEEFLHRFNIMCGKFIKQHSKTELGKDKDLKGTEMKTDMKYRIEIDEHDKGPGVRIDVYPSSGDGGRKGIAGERVKIKFFWNKRNQIDLETDGLTIIPSVPPNNKLKGWQIALIVSASTIALLALIFFIFRRQIKDWWRKRKNKGSKEAQLEVF
ncbi:hypothetical protein [endosymbiont GvMRE of Glomus versiforme]|uniref:hypothetical protein n=1 Tax=endosymbiont GvMRE of Glomus versiforme TaxID=2039283 RepID=UPI000EC0973A|nr:hypothetical protein [endosymbiont GvMRE of Glomus versiforme]RHZ36681.1 hypothetical protein GvMRE_I2g579 [endosymbiont GvMRE of Glomus versiforme]